MKKKYYTVWNGVEPGVYDSWSDCQAQIKGYAGAVYKSFGSREEAEGALVSAACEYFGRKAGSNAAISGSGNGRGSGSGSVGGVKKKYILRSIAVDAACSGNPGDVEYRGVYVETGQELFHVGPMKRGTNNIGEFLALVHGLAMLKKSGSSMPVYSDSYNAILWVSQKKCKTKLERTAINTPLFELIERAERWLQTNEYSSPVLKWETSKWGEIPADFGRK